MKKLLIGAMVLALASVVAFIFQPNINVSPEQSVATLIPVEKPQEITTFHVEGTTSIVMETKPQN